MKKSINIANILLSIILQITVAVSTDLTAGPSALHTQPRQSLVTNEEAVIGALRPHALMTVSLLNAGLVAASTDAASPGLTLGGAAYNVADTDESSDVLGLFGLMVWDT
jgi:hypothetical protein